MSENERDEPTPEGDEAPPEGEPTVEGAEPSPERDDASTGDEPAAEGAEQTPERDDASTGDAAPGERTPQAGGAPGVEEAAEPEPAGAQGSGDEPSAEAAEPEPERTAPDPEPEPEERRRDPDQPPGAELDPIAIEPERELSAEERAEAEAEAEERARREAAAAAEEIEEPAPKRQAVSLDDQATIQATGKRKNAVARVLVRRGSGQIEVNARRVEDYFPRAADQSMARQALSVTGYEGSLDVRVRVHGGGISGQAGAVRHGIARALCEVDPELRGELKRRGLLTRDSRAKERRKAGLKKARKRPQFSKR